MIIKEDTDGSFDKQEQQLGGHRLSESMKSVIATSYVNGSFHTNPTAYFYNLTQISKNASLLRALLPPQVRVYYAMKANPHPMVMGTLCQAPGIAGVEIASAGELDVSLRFLSAKQIVFTGPGKTDIELRKAIEQGIYLINIESVTEAFRIQRIATELDITSVDVLLRININYMIDAASEHMSGCSTKMGIDESELPKAFQWLQTLDRIRIKGLHVFAASGVLDYEQLIKCQEYIFRLVKNTEKIAGHLPIIDFGGGLGIDYSNNNLLFDLIRYCNGLRGLIERYNFTNKELILELGTYLVGNAGYYTAKIVDIKEIKGKKHIVLAGGVNHMGLPLEMRRKHPVEIIPMHEPKLYDEQPCVDMELADISGPLCMVTDILCWDEILSHAEIGDIAVFFQAGAYCYEEGMHDFLKHPLPNIQIVEVSP